MRFFFIGPRFFGIRPGISLNPRDFRKFAPRGAIASGSTGGFVYVLNDQSGRHKIGSSRDPIARIAQLQTGSAERLDFAYIGVASGDSYLAIERAAHDLLERQKMPEGGDEWFKVPASIAIGAVIEVANRIGEAIQQVPPAMVPQIIQVANQPAKSTGRLKRGLGIVAGGIVGLLAALVIVAFISVMASR